MSVSQSNIIYYFENGSAATYTHFMYNQTNKKQKLIDERSGKFWKNYCAKIHAKEKMLIGERIRHQSPVVLNIQFCFKEEVENFDQHLWPMLMEILFHTHRIFFDHLQQPEDRCNIFASVILAPTKSFINGEGFTTYCYRFQFPYCRTAPKFQKDVLLAELIRKCRSENVASCIEAKMLTDWTEIIKLPTETVPMFGSSESSSREPLIYRAMYTNICDLDLEEDNPNERAIKNLSEVFEPKMHDHVQKGLINENFMDFEDHPLVYWLPMFLSVSYYNKVVLPKEDTIKITPCLDMNMQSSDEQDILESLLPHIDKKRYKTESGWMDVGRALHYVYKGGARGKTHWIELTEKETTFDTKLCEKKYDRFTKTPMITHRTIAWYVFQDNPEEYDRWHRLWLQPAIDQVLSERLKPTSGDVAALIYRKYWLTFMYEQGTWFEFKNHGWTRYTEKEPSCLMQKIMTDFIPWLQNLRKEYTLKQNETEDDATAQSVYEPKISCLTCLVKLMKTPAYLGPTAKMCHLYFTLDGFKSQLDINPRLLRVINGVIECQDKEAQFRPGKPEDYLTLCAGVRYNTSLKYTDQIVQDYMNWMKQLFIDPDVTSFFMKLQSSFLLGGNVNKFFVVYSGAHGNGGKSTICSVQKKAFGEYNVDIPTSVLTQKRGQSGSASPEMARLGFARLATAKETDETEKFHIGIIKELTGSDSFFARFLHDNGRDIEPLFKLIFHCNIVPMMRNEQAMKNRLVNIPFHSIYCKDAPDTVEEQFKVRKFPLDPLFRERIPDFAEAYLWLCVYFYKRYASEGLDPPKAIRENTEAYWRSVDYIQHFVDSELTQEAVPVGGKAKCSLLKKDAWESYYNYMKTMHPRAETYNSDFFYKEMERVIGPAKDKRWEGYRLNETVYVGNT